MTYQSDTPQSPQCTITAEEKFGRLWREMCVRENYSKKLPSNKNPGMNLNLGNSRIQAMDEVAYLLRNSGPMTARGVSAEIGKSINTVKAYLYEMMRDGKIRNAGMSGRQALYEVIS